MTGMSGRLILNLEALFAVATVLLLLWRSHGKSGGAIPSPRFAIDFSDGLRMASVALLSVIVFWRAAHIYFLSDDFVLVNMAKTFQGWSGLEHYNVMFTRGGGDGFYRPVGYISLFWTWPWAGLDPSRWHWVGLILHVLCALLVYVLAGAIGLSRTGAWLASALFALHGSHPEAMLWIAGRFDVLSTALVLVSLVAFIRMWERPSAVAAVVAGLGMSLGILCKESAYAAPLMMLVFVLSRPGSLYKEAWKRRIRFVAPFFLLAGLPVRVSLGATRRHRWIRHRGRPAADVLVGRAFDWESIGPAAVGDFVLSGRLGGERFGVAGDRTAGLRGRLGCACVHEPRSARECPGLLRARGGASSGAAVVDRSGSGEGSPVVSALSGILPAGCGGDRRSKAAPRRGHRHVAV